MTFALREWRDRLLGRGAAAVTTPIFDGALKPNQILESSPVAAHFTASNDIASDGQDVFVADGHDVLRLDAEGRRHAIYAAGGEITALTVLGGRAPRRIAVAVQGREVRLLDGQQAIRVWTEAGGRPLTCVNALSDGGDGRLLATEGSSQHDVSQWQRDLLTRGSTGRAIEFRCEGDAAARVLASGLRWPFGIQPDGPDGFTVSESWHHRLISKSAGKLQPVLNNLPGYPSRMAPAADGGWWLTVFACRSQLVEFVLREPTLRRRMLEEIDARYWIAPALSSGQSFLEPLQGGGVKQMGIIKPWAPPRSYGLVVRLDAGGRPLFSLHSRVGGLHHGIVAAAEAHGALYVLARGPGRLLKLDLSTLKEQFE